jgi:hypothetical protein
MVLETIVTGALSGLAYSLLGYGKNAGQELDVEKLAQTVIVGILAGVSVATMGGELEVWTTVFINMGVTASVINGAKTIKRRLIK